MIIFLREILYFLVFQGCPLLFSLFLFRSLLWSGIYASVTVTSML